jgi:hypothetical protein
MSASQKEKGMMPVCDERFGGSSSKQSSASTSHLPSAQYHPFWKYHVYVSPSAICSDLNNQCLSAVCAFDVPLSSIL